MFGKRVRMLRKELGLTQKDLGNKFNVSDRVVGYWETDDRLPDANILKQLSELFDVSLDYLLGRTDKRKIEEMTVDEKLKAALSDPDLMVAFNDYDDWSDEEKEELLRFIEFQKMKREKDNK